MTSGAAVPHSWTPDGSTLAVIQFSSDTNDDIFVLTPDGDRRPQPLIRTPFLETGPEFSPDGHWLAYASTESGRPEVYVQPYPGPGARHLISTDGGIQPAWSRDRRELFFTTLPSPDGVITMMAVPVSVSPTFSAGAPRVLFRGRYASTPTTRFYDVAPDGRFLMMREAERPPIKPTQMILVQNWFEELKRLVPTN
jgi:serine/threonine-protein kinase